MGERFYFGDNLTTNAGYQVAKHKPQPGAAIVEVLDGGGRILCMDAFKVTKPAPFGSINLKPIVATLVRPGSTGFRHQEFECSFEDSPLKLPKHLRDKVEMGAKRLRVWWSCEST